MIESSCPNAIFQKGSNAKSKIEMLYIEDGRIKYNVQGY